MIFGLSLLPLLFATGAAVDYGRRSSAKARVDAALDAAVLGLASRKLETYDQAMVTKAQNQFMQQASAVSGVSDVEVTIPVPTNASGKITISGSYTAKVSTMLPALMKARSMRISGSATASKTVVLYTDLYMALDVSQSMGLASTNDGAKSLFSLVKSREQAAGNSTAEGCVFGCHVPFPTGTGPGRTKLTDSYETIAHNNNIELRIDVLKSSVLKTINTADTDSKGTNRYRMALYTMGLASAYGSTSGLNELSGLTSSFLSLRTAADRIDLGPNNSGGTGDSFLASGATAHPLTALRGKIPLPAGDGTTQSNPRVFLFIVTDGLSDTPGSGCTSGHCIGVMNTAVCNEYKSRNVTVGVIYTTYLPILKDPTGTSTNLEGNYKSLVADPKWDTKIAPALKSCSSGGDWYAEASDGPAIDAALAKMFAQTSLTPSLTN